MTIGGERIPLQNGYFEPEEQPEQSGARGLGDGGVYEVSAEMTIPFVGDWEFKHPICDVCNREVDMFNRVFDPTRGPRGVYVLTACCHGGIEKVEIDGDELDTMKMLDPKSVTIGRAFKRERLLP